MKRNPIFTFDNRDSVGINTVPIGSIIQVTDAGNADGGPTITMLTTNVGFVPTTKVGEFLDSTDYVELDKDTVSQLGLVTEGINTGWRLLNVDSSTRERIGQDAIDLSIDGPGAPGNYSFSSGRGTKALNENSVAMGAYNIGTSPATILEFGNGVVGTPQNAFEIYKNGIVVAPGATNVDIDNTTGALTTKDYVSYKIESILSSKTTTDVVEGINLYFTDARFNAGFINNLLGSSINELKDVDTASVAPLADQILVWNETISKWIPQDNVATVSSVNSHVGDVILDSDDIAESVVNLYYTETRDTDNFNSNWSTKSTDDLPEGAKLYYTDARVETKTKQLPLDTFVDVDLTTIVPALDQILSFNGTKWVASDMIASRVNSVNGEYGDVNLGMNDLIDVDVVVNPIPDGYMLAWNNSISTWGLSAPVKVANDYSTTMTSDVDALSQTMGIDLDARVAINSVGINTNGISISSKEDRLGTPTTNGDVLVSTVAGVRSWMTLVSGATPVDNLLGTDPSVALASTQGPVINNLINNKEDKLPAPGTNTYVLTSDGAGGVGWSAPGGSGVIVETTFGSTIATSASSIILSNDLDARVTTNTTAVGVNVSNITSLSADIVTNTTDITTNATDIATNVTGIATNVTAIATNVTDIATNVTSIATNATAIATNATDIATNVTSITTNTADIVANATAIATNVTNLGDVTALTTTAKIAATAINELNTNKEPLLPAQNTAVDMVLTRNAGSDFWSASGATTVIDNLTSTSTTDALSANQGNVLLTAMTTGDSLNLSLAGGTMTGSIKGMSPVAPEDLTRKDYVDTKESGLGNPTTDDYILSSTIAGIRSWVIPPVEVTVVDDLITTTATDALSANQGSVLDARVTTNLTSIGDITALVPLAVDLVTAINNKTGIAVADITIDGSETTAANAAKINELLASLRTAGIIT